MATLYSDQFTKVRNARLLQPNEQAGKLRTLRWDFASLPAGNIADVLVCGFLPKGARVLMGREAHSALSSGGGTCTASYGIHAVLADGLSLGAVIDVDRWLVATSFEAAGGNPLADTIAHFIGHELAQDSFVTCTNSVEAFATAGQITGVLFWTVD